MTTEGSDLFCCDDDAGVVEVSPVPSTTTPQKKPDDPSTASVLINVFDWSTWEHD